MKIPYSAILMIVVTTTVVSSSAVVAQIQNTEHTYKSGDAERPPATLADVAWLTGSWKGTAFGNSFEEVWNPASAGSMVGMFKVFDEKDGVSFYELMLLVEHDDSLVLKVKHFTEDFVAWEDKPDYISFPLVKLEQNAIHFSGLSFYKDGQNKITGYIALKNSAGEINEEKLSYIRRTDLQ